MRNALTAVIVVALGLAYAAPAFAAEAGQGEKPGLLDPDIYSAATAIVVFVLLLLVLTKFAWKPILASMKSREDAIQDALDEAKAANEKARELIAQYESKLDAARQEAQAIADEARSDAMDIKAQIEADARKAADETVVRAKVEIEQASAKAWDQIVRDAASIATEAAGRIVSAKLAPEGHAEIVAGVVSDFANKRSGGV